MSGEFGFFVQNAWLVPAIPFFSFLIGGLILKPLFPKSSGVFATISLFASAFCALMLGWQYFRSAYMMHTTLIPWSFEWLSYQENLTVQMGVLLDPLSVLMMIVVTVVSSLVHLYSLGYMKGESGYARYFIVLNFFTFSMLGLVTSPNLVGTFVFWELVGASSFFLIGYYYEKPSAVAASKKAFIVTRFADLGFLIGLMILGYLGFQFYPQIIQSGLSVQGQALDFTFINDPVVVSLFQENSDVLLLALLLLFTGAAGKSAMFPLHIWLPDAMEGPTPVSALIHAATMVTAGVFLVARLMPLYLVSETALTVVTYVGIFTCIFAALIACTQNDIKRVLAFSTLSQLGYMMFALGLCTSENTLGYMASTFHLFTHAFFKSLLFLGAGSIIHAVHSNDIWKMGGLRYKMPVTHFTFLIATLAIAGIPPLAGFYSKDEILLAALESHQYFVFITALIVAGLTAFYMFRIYFVSFWGQGRSTSAEQAKESPTVMLLPLSILAVFSISAGWVPLGNFVYLPLKSSIHIFPFWLPLVATSVGILGIILAWWKYARKDQVLVPSPPSHGILKLVQNKFYIDEVYLFITHKLIFRFVATPAVWFDRHIVDGGVNLSGWIIRQSGEKLRLLQTGQIQTYCLWFVGGGLFIFLFFYFSRISI